MAEADNLQRFTVSSATASNIILGGVGTDATFTGASDLEFVSISAGVASTSSSGVSMPTTPFGIGGAGAATVTTILVNGATASTIVLGGSPAHGSERQRGPGSPQRRACRRRWCQLAAGRLDRHHDDQLRW
jgi:hypothetical protein